MYYVLKERREIAMANLRLAFGDEKPELKLKWIAKQSFRNMGIYYEELTNEILDDLTAASKPRWMKITSRFTPRGGITTDVTAEYKAKT